MSRYNRQDRFFKKAKQDSYAARSVYKLEEIDRRFHIFKKGARIVDLGCAPGSWLQYLADAVGPHGLVVGYDLAPVTISAGPQVVAFQADVHALDAARIRRDVCEALARGAAGREETGDPGEAGREGRGEVRIDALISDMAPKLSGIRDADQARSIGLVEQALGLAEATVAAGGAFVAKVFQGRDTDALLLRVKRSFAEVRVLKPEATREGSREVFIVARARRGGTPGAAPTPPAEDAPR